jgi:recombination protein RecA
MAAAASLRVIEGSVDKDKEKSLAAALSQIERNFGKGTVMKFDQGAITQVESIST